MNQLNQIQKLLKEKVDCQARLNHNGIVNGVKATDVQKILNLKHAWE